eukprot:TRINITY_DN173_c0_g3_i2.p1 TRINITY_DN173_c0_g3~~TRINITY_DN173_c0_g3_i2.p1  ORF type:complete len:878 (-),score=228.86 TRINITY_DN173_c0_g3_i2:124-2757(-)
MLRSLFAEGGIYTGVSPLTDNDAVFIVQAIIIIVLSRGLHRLCERLRQPLVIYEIIAGVMLGPTLMARVPNFTKYIFPTASYPLLKLAADCGMFIYLFTVGAEVDVDRVFKNFKRSAAISMTGLIFPFVLGISVSSYIYNHLLTDIAAKVPFSSFAVFLGVAMSITSFTVLSRILVEQKLIRLKAGLLVVSSAAVDDLIGWSLLAVVICLLSVGKSMLSALWIFMTLIGYATFLLFFFRKYFHRYINYMEKRPSRWGILFATTFVCLLFSAYVTQLIGLHAIFGAFLFGLCLPHGSAFSHKVLTRIEDFNATFLVPLYFAYSGLRTDIGSLSDGSAWIALLLAILVAFGGKLVGCTLAAKASGATWREATTIGVLMNCKGLTEIVVLNLGMDIGVINTKVFTIMILMTFITTFLTTPLVARTYPMEERLRDLEIVDEEDRKAGKGQQLDEVKEEIAGHPVELEERPRGPTSGEPLRKVSDRVPQDSEHVKKFGSLNVCIPFQYEDEAADIASFLSLFGSSAQSVKLSVLKMMELTDNGLLSEDFLAVPRNGLSSHEFAVANDVSLKLVNSYARLSSSVDIQCALRLGNSKEFAAEISGMASALNSHLIALPMHRKNDGTMSEDFEEVEYVHYVLEIAQASKTPYALFLDARHPTSPAKKQRVCVVHQDSCGLELLALARHILAKGNTHVDIILLREDKGANENSAYAIVEDPKDGIAMTKSAFKGDHSSITFHYIPPTDDCKEVLQFIESENNNDPFSLVMFGGDSQVPLGFVDVTTFFGSFGNNLMDMQSLNAALLVMHKPLIRTVDHHTSSRSVIPSFLFANGQKDMVLVGEGKKSFNTNYAAHQGTQSHLSKVFTPADLAKAQAVEGEKKTHNV